MIKNERQLKITNSWLKKFTASLKEISTRKYPDVHPLLTETEKNGIRSQIRDFKSEIREYNRLKKSKTSRIGSLLEVGKALVKARIMNNLTQKQLAKKLNVAEQQVQRWEEDNYSKAALHTIIEVAEELNLMSTRITIFVNTTKLLL